MQTQYLEGTVNGIMPDKHGVCISVLHETGQVFLTLAKGCKNMTAREVLDLFNVDDFGEIKGKIIQLKQVGTELNQYEPVF